MSKILIVEDDKFLQDLYFHTFSLSGYDVLVAKDGLEGLEKVSEFKPELILLDMMMPKMNGLDFLRNIKKNEEIKNIPVVVLSNYSNEPQQNEALVLGALTFVIKSEYDPSQVVQLAKDILDGTFVPKPIPVTTGNGGT
jgi:CheY-like chemotaxis protein